MSDYVDFLKELSEIYEHCQKVLPKLQQLKEEAEKLQKVQPSTIAGLWQKLNYLSKESRFNWLIYHVEGIIHFIDEIRENTVKK